MGAKITYHSGPNYEHTRGLITVEVEWLRSNPKNVYFVCKDAAAHLAIMRERRTAANDEAFLSLLLIRGDARMVRYRDIEGE